jgi:hypothetical protein
MERSFRTLGRGLQGAIRLATTIVYKRIVNIQRKPRGVFRFAISGIKPGWPGLN